MKYRIEYKTLEDVITMYNKNSNQMFVEDKDMKTYELFFSDLFIVYKENKIINIFSDKKETLQIICLNSFDKHRQLLTKIFRCVILNYKDIVKKIEYSEFCKRYKYRI